MKYKSAKSGRAPAPALAQGICALAELSSAGPLRLEELSRRTGVNKPSLLRLLNTLIGLGMVSKDEATKVYRAVSVIVMRSPGLDELSARIPAELKRLSGLTGRTSEWYVPGDGVMMLSDRCEPEDCAVNVKARIGFERELDGELEAVARLALGCGAPRPAGKTAHWNYMNGKKAKIPASKAAKLIASAGKAGHCLDTEYNVNGVRRYAAAVRHADGNFVGIIAVAENFTPDADSKAASTVRALLESADRLSSMLKH